jgi:hypothetical protein
LSVSNVDAAIRKFASGVMWGTEVQSTGEDLDGSSTPTGPDTYHRWGRIQKGVYELKRTQQKDKDQGQVEVVVGNDSSGTFVYDLMQRSKDYLNLPALMDSHYIRFICELTRTSLNGKMQYLVIASALIDPSTKIDGSNMYPNHQFTCYPYAGASALTVTLTGLVGSKGTVGTLTATINVGDYHAIVDVTA